MLTFFNNPQDTFVKEARLVFRDSEKAPKGAEAAERASKTKKETPEAKQRRLKERADQILKDMLERQRNYKPKPEVSNEKQPDTVTGDAEVDKALAELKRTANEVKVNENSSKLSLAAQKYADTTGAEKARARAVLLGALKTANIERGDSFIDPHVGNFIAQRTPQGKPDGYMVVLIQRDGTPYNIYFGAKEGDFTLSSRGLVENRARQIQARGKVGF